jgi:Mg2+ and Co2+ transporter CorA
LIALKDSQAVEKLTRITILLAKATMLFLPVSLMTAYFSTELAGVKGVYTQAEYWVAFAVIFVVTVLVLTIFGYASDTVEGKTIYRSLVKTFFRRSRQRITGRAKRQD